MLSIATRTSSNHSGTIDIFSKMALTLSRLLNNFSYITNVLCKVGRSEVWIIVVACLNGSKNLSKNSDNSHSHSERANSRNSSFVATHGSIAARKYIPR